MLLLVLEKMQIIRCVSMNRLDISDPSYNHPSELYIDVIFDPHDENNKDYRLSTRQRQDGHVAPHPSDGDVASIDESSSPPGRSCSKRRSEDDDARGRGCSRDRVQSRGSIRERGANADVLSRNRRGRSWAKCTISRIVDLQKHCEELLNYACITCGRFFNTNTARGRHCDVMRHTLN